MENPQETLKKSSGNPSENPWKKPLIKPLENPWKTFGKTLRKPSENSWKTLGKLSENPWNKTPTKPLENPSENPKNTIKSPIKTLALPSTASSPSGKKNSTIPTSEGSIPTHQALVVLPVDADPGILDHHVGDFPEIAETAPLGLGRRRLRLLIPAFPPKISTLGEVFCALRGEFQVFPAAGKGLRGGYWGNWDEAGG